MTLVRVLAVVALVGLLVPAAIYGQWVFVALGLVGVAAFLLPFFSRR